MNRNHLQITTPLGSPLMLKLQAAGLAGNPFEIMGELYLFAGITVSNESNEARFDLVKK